jgi:hypothetical protein
MPPPQYFCSMTNPNHLNALHPDLIAAKELIYDVCGFKLTQLKAAAESADYAACSFYLNEFSIQFRAAKITPTKTGQFVTIWKRTGNGPIEPFHILDRLDFVIISTRSGNYCGQFIFPKTVLAAKGIVTANGKEGKRGIRVYPPWDKAGNKQAEKTQQWQLHYFLEMPPPNAVNIVRAKELFAV